MAKWIVGALVLAGIGGLAVSMLPELQRELNIMRM
jgi:hypothetical protein